MQKLPPLMPGQVRRLRPELIRNPRQMIYEFCDLFEMEESRDLLWEMVFSFFCGEECDGLDRFERSKYLFFSKQIEALLEAAFLMNEKAKMKKKQNEIAGDKL